MIYSINGFLGSLMVSVRVGEVLPQPQDTSVYSLIVNAKTYNDYSDKFDASWVEFWFFDKQINATVPPNDQYDSIKIAIDESGNLTLESQTITPLSFIKTFVTDYFLKDDDGNINKYTAVFDWIQSETKVIDPPTTQIYLNKDLQPSNVPPSALFSYYVFEWDPAPTKDDLRGLFSKNTNPELFPVKPKPYLIFEKTTYEVFPEGYIVGIDNDIPLVYLIGTVTVPFPSYFLGLSTKKSFTFTDLTTIDMMFYPQDKNIIDVMSEAGYKVRVTRFDLAVSKVLDKDGNEVDYADKFLGFASTKYVEKCLKKGQLCWGILNNDIQIFVNDGTGVGFLL